MKYRKIMTFQLVEYVTSFGHNQKYCSFLSQLNFLITIVIAAQRKFLNVGYVWKLGGNRLAETFGLQDRDLISSRSRLAKLVFRRVHVRDQVSRLHHWWNSVQFLICFQSEACIKPCDCMHVSEGVVPSPRGGALVGLAVPPNKAPSPPIKIWNTINPCFYQIFRMSSPPCTNVKTPIEDFLATVLRRPRALGTHLEA